MEEASLAIPVIVAIAIEKRFSNCFALFFSVHIVIRIYVKRLDWFFIPINRRHLY